MLFRGPVPPRLQTTRALAPEFHRAMCYRKGWVRTGKRQP
jgi:hypothetical protein